jgi:hypothetical protein
MMEVESRFSVNGTCANASKIFGHHDECGGGMAFVFAGLPALVIAFTAKRFYKQTLFLAGFGAAARVTQHTWCLLGIILFPFSSCCIVERSIRPLATSLRTRSQCSPGVRYAQKD